jgi:predicted TIM-barrel fold metal-dependent hydrolase
MDDYVGSRLLSVWGQENCMWSSDYPHGNTTWPQSRAFISRQCADLSEATKTRVLSQNVIDLYGLPF